MNPLLFEVAFIPKEVNSAQAPICVVIDVIRASTTMVTLLENGCSEVILTGDEKETFDQYKRSGVNEILVCAENEDGNVAEHAHFSPSLVTLGNHPVQGKRVIFRTTNGTRAAQTLWNQGIEQIYIGCMNNAEAVMKEVVKKAVELGRNIAVVCAGRENGEIPALDDAYTAGILIRYGRQAAQSLGVEFQLRDSAKIAQHLNDVYPETVDAFSQSGSGETMRRIHCVDDIALCARANISKLTPSLSLSKENGNIIVKNSNEVIYQ